MTRWFPESEEFVYEGDSVYARQDVGTDDGIDLRHSATSDNSTVSAGLVILAGITVNP